MIAYFWIKFYFVVELKKNYKKQVVKNKLLKTSCSIESEREQIIIIISSNIIIIIITNVLLLFQQCIAFL